MGRLLHRLGGAKANARSPLVFSRNLVCDKSDWEDDLSNLAGVYNLSSSILLLYLDHMHQRLLVTTVPSLDHL